MDTNFKKIKKLPVLIISIFVFIYVTISISINTQTIPVNSIQDIKVYPGGGIVGIKMYVQGVLVAGFSDVLGVDGKIYKPAESTDIKPRR